MPEHYDDEMLRDVLTTSRHIALVGISDRPHRPSYTTMSYLLAQGYVVTPVNPRLAGKRVLDQPVVATLADIGHPIDMVDCFRRSEFIEPLAEEAVALGAQTLWLQLGVINEQAARTARDAGLTVIMDRCPRIEIERLGLSAALRQ